MKEPSLLDLKVIESPSIREGDVLVVGTNGDSVLFTNILSSETTGKVSTSKEKKDS